MAAHALLVPVTRQGRLVRFRVGTRQSSSSSSPRSPFHATSYAFYAWLSEGAGSPEARGRREPTNPCVAEWATALAALGGTAGNGAGNPATGHEVRRVRPVRTPTDP